MNPIKTVYLLLIAVNFFLLPLQLDAQNCSALTPAGTASQNRTNIINCLASVNYAYLNYGTFDVDGGITVGTNQILSGNSPYFATIRMTSTGSNFLIKTVGNSATVSWLTLDGNNMVGGANAAVVSIEGNNASVESSYIQNATIPPANSRIIGVSVLCDGCTGNQIYNNQIRRNFLGVVMRDGLDTSEINTLSSSIVYDNKCDGVTLRSYGVVENSYIYHNGFDCDFPGGAIPGAGLFAHANFTGAEISWTHIYENCGHNIDLDAVANFYINSNTLYNPGYQFGGSYTHCGTAVSLSFIDSSNSQITYNSVKNEGSIQNKLGGNPVIGEMTTPNGSPTYSFADLPSGGNQVIAFFFGQRKGSVGVYTNGNNIVGNHFVAHCTPTNQCMGLGFFASRRTGYGLNYSWSGSTTNYYTSNSTYGSQLGSKRCGGNWYAANSSCPVGFTDPQCNDDDPQHNSPVGDWARNDQCYGYY